MSEHTQLTIAYLALAIIFLLASIVAARSGRATGAALFAILTASNLCLVAIGLLQMAGLIPQPL